METRRRILVILPNNLGDIIMATPLLEGLKQRYPDAQLTFFAEEGFEGGIERNPHVDDLFLFKRRTIRDAFWRGAWAEGSQECIAAIEQLRSKEVDWCINLSQQSYTANLAPLLKARAVTGCSLLREGNDALAGDWVFYLYAVPFARRCNSLHVADVYRRIGGVFSHRGGYTITITAREKNDAREYLQSIGVECAKDNIAVLQPGAALPSKKWPAEHFIALGRMLAGQGWQIIVSGASAERELAEHIRTAIGRGSFCTAGETTFRRALANLAQARVCVSGDTALMHAAAGLGVRTIGLFGATSPLETGPYGNGSMVFCGTCPEKPCFRDRCASMRCMNTILPETLFSCIVQAAMPRNPGCDVYRTSLAANGDYALVPATTNAFSYFEPAAALLAQRAFGEVTPVPAYAPQEKEQCRKESQRTIDIVTGMERNLRDYLNGKEIADVRKFEKAKDELENFSGIGCFWAALLNLELNSIGMLNPEAGVRLSGAACAGVVRRIENALAIL